MNTIIPWISGGLILLLALGVWQTLRFWRESKKSPYYFLRRQAEQKMQTYSMGTVAAAVLLLFFVSYAWQPAEDTSIRMIEIHNAKPQSLAAAPTTESTQIISQQSENLIIESESSPSIIALEGDSSVELSAELISSQSDKGIGRITSEDLLPFETIEAEGASIAELDEASGSVALPAEYDQLTASVDLSEATSISELTFSNGINEISYEPTAPAKLYNEGFYTVYATFDYDNMADGMVWSWVWRQDGRVIGGGNETWNYGADGPGYIFLAPTTGFNTGEYVVEVWVNGEMQATANMFVTDDLATSQ